MSNPEPFYGRVEELDTLKEFLNRDSACLLVIKGRRRIGKSRLLNEFAKYFKRGYTFTGIAPTKETTAASQRKEFAGQLKRNMNIPPIKADDWSDLFWFMANQVSDGKAFIILDEITWMGSKDPDFLPKLNAAWDLYLKHNPKLVLAICGSMSAWIDKNLLGSAGFMGRPALDMTVYELPLKMCNKFWKGKPISAYEKFKILAVTGGIPRYLELINPNKTAEHNLQLHCFNENGVLFKEFDLIFTDLFGTRNKIYADICKVLINGPVTQTKIISALKITKSGNISEYLDELVKSGFISRDYTWNLATGDESDQSKYRLSDNYVRFYLKYILPNKARIKRGLYKDYSLAKLPGWYSKLGYQFENLVLNNRDAVISCLALKKEDVVNDGPYFQTETKRRKACQIDHMIQTITNTLYLVELKLSKNLITSKVIKEVEEKMSKLYLTKRYSIRPVLIHVNGVEQSIIDSDFFAKIIDFGDLL